MPEQPGEIYIIGLGGHARVVASIALAMGYKIAGFLDENPRPQDPPAILGAPVLGHLDILASLAHPAVVIGIGQNRHRHKVLQAARELNPHAIFPSLIHPSAIVDPSALLGQSITICAGAIICVEAQIGDGTLINTGATIDHECVIGQYCHISPGAHLAGRVRMGDFAHIGTGVAVIPGIQIGAHATIGAGAAVIRDIPDGVTAVGVPAKVIK